MNQSSVASVEMICSLHSIPSKFGFSESQLLSLVNALPNESVDFSKADALLAKANLAALPKKDCVNVGWLLYVTSLLLVAKASQVDYAKMEPLLKSYEAFVQWVMPKVSKLDQHLSSQLMQFCQPILDVA